MSKLSSHTSQRKQQAESATLPKSMRKSVTARSQTLADVVNKKRQSSAKQTRVKQSSTSKAELLSTEEKIIRAAHSEFVKKGFDGARMQKIADVAGINKALLHYYFRSKEQLFSAVFVALRDSMVQGILGKIEKSTTLREAVTAIVTAQIEVNLQHRGLYLFVLSELSRKPELIHSMFQRDQSTSNLFRTVFQTFIGLIERAVRTKEIRRIEPLQLLLNILSMNNFPFVAQPIFQHITFMSNDEFIDLQERRKEHIVDFVMNALRP